MALSPDEILERSQWDTFWVPSNVKVIERDELLYLSCPRDSTYLNMVTRTRAAPTDYPALIDEVVQAHGERRSRWLIPPTLDAAPLEGRLGEAGYTLASSYRVSMIDTSDYKSRPTPDDLVVRLVIDKEGLRDNLAVLDTAFGDLGPRGADDDSHDLKLCTGRDARVLRFIGYDGKGEPLAAGNMTLFPKLSFGLLWSGATKTEARGRGVYSALLAARIVAAEQLGIDSVGLLADEASTAPMVARQGFSQHGTAHYWLRSPVG
ncbi:MAG: hypothetical protein JRH20_11950 [Deltaproteobacteria bacterium]|nr:hypothetical protein [Deltaproteobacteria bacterium]